MKVFSAAAISAAYPWPDSPTWMPTAWSRLCIVSLKGPRPKEIASSWAAALPTSCGAGKTRSMSSSMRPGRRKSVGYGCPARARGGGGVGLTIDEERATFIQKYFGKEWPNRHLYHLMIDQFQDWRRSCGARDAERRVGSSTAPAASFRLPSAYDEYNATLATTRFATTTGKAWMISP